MLKDSIPRRYEVQPRGDANRRSSIVFVKPLTESLEELSGRLSAEGIDVARRTGMVRFAPHLYNGVTDVERVIEVLG